MTTIINSSMIIVIKFNEGYNDICIEMTNMKSD